jgi:cytochrome c biogenesis protein CcmG, thiol:disulfide interchange protein DsbE
MNRQWLAVGGIVGLIVALIGAGWLVRDRFLPVEPGREAPSFVATDLEGNTVQLADLRGEVVLLNIWATWCAPCRQEMPSMQRLHERMGPRGVKIVAVSVDVQPGRVDAGGNPGGRIPEFAAEMGLTFPIWHDPEGNIQRIYRTTGVPESFVIDRSGMIVTKVQGPEEWDSEANIELFERLLEG